MKGRSPAGVIFQTKPGGQNNDDVRWGEPGIRSNVEELAAMSSGPPPRILSHGGIHENVGVGILKWISGCGPLQQTIVVSGTRGFSKQVAHRRGKK